MRHKRVAFQGERGAFSKEAVMQLIGDRVELEPRPAFRDVFQSLRSGQVDYAVIPIENTLAGSVHENYDYLLQFKLPIVAETRVRIVHNLIARPGVGFTHVRRVFSHPVALGQCRRFFEKHPRVASESYYDTAGSVKMLMEQAPDGAAAIASAAAARFYGAHILKRSIEDDRRNFTRFFLLARKAPAATPGKHPKTSIVFATRNVPGALFRCLSAFALRDINLAKIESRPLRGRPWEYLFYLDFLGSIDEPRCHRALEHLQELTDLLQVLGCYQEAGATPPHSGAS